MGELVVGIGFRTDATASDIVDAVGRWWDSAAVAALATIDRRADHPGLRSAAAQLDVPVVVFTATELAAVPVPNPSKHSLEHLGTGSVAEAAAILAADGGELVDPKRVVHGIVLAAAERAWTVP